MNFDPMNEVDPSVPSEEIKEETQETIQEEIAPDPQAEAIAAGMADESKHKSRGGVCVFCGVKANRCPVLSKKIREAEEAAE